jgi:toxin CcdB
MRQLDVFMNPFPRSRERQPFLVNLQSDFLARTLSTVVVAPLERAGAGQIERLNPKIMLEGKEYVLATQEIVAIRASLLGPVTATIADDRDAIIAALDLLFTGF